MKQWVASHRTSKDKLQKVNGAHLVAVRARGTNASAPNGRAAVRILARGKTNNELIVVHQNVKSITVDAADVKVVNDVLF